MRGDAQRGTGFRTPAAFGRATHSGQIVRVAGFVAATYNGDAFKPDPFELDCVDAQSAVVAWCVDEQTESDDPPTVGDAVVEAASKDFGCHDRY